MNISLYINEISMLNLQYGGNMNVKIVAGIPINNRVGAENQRFRRAIANKGK